MLRQLSHRPSRQLDGRLTSTRRQSGPTLGSTERHPTNGQSTQIDRHFHIIHVAYKSRVSKHLTGFSFTVRIKTWAIDIHRSSAQVDDKIVPLGAKDREISSHYLI